MMEIFSLIQGSAAVTLKPSSGNMFGRAWIAKVFYKNSFENFNLNHLGISILQ
jgi:hypothetical protein